MQMSVTLPPVLGQDAPDESWELPPNKARIVVTSDPTNLAILLDGRRLGESTKAVLDVNPGQYLMTLNAEGYQPLNHDVAVAAGEVVELEFILLETPPEPPTAEELRALSPPFGADDPNSEFWAEAGPRHMANESCRDCHSPILTLHAQGEHRNLACEDCHSALSDHVTDNVVTGTMQVVRGEGIQGMCMLCHDQNNRNRKREPARTVDLRRHLQKLRVTPVNLCQECHHVHDPMKWVHEAREMVGLPEKMATIPLLKEKAADEKRQPYISMAEIFLVFPTAPGLLGKVAAEGGGDFPSEILLTSGLTLVAGSYLLGQLAHSRELEKIRGHNEERKATNARVREHNLRVEQAMAEHAASVARWHEASAGRGEVIVHTR
jgi:PEGA domain